MVQWDGKRDTDSRYLWVIDILALEFTSAGCIYGMFSVSRHWKKCLVRWNASGEHNGENVLRQFTPFFSGCIFSHTEIGAFIVDPKTEKNYNGMRLLFGLWSIK